MSLLRYLFLLAAKNNFTVTMKHLPGKQNDIADALSRKQYNRIFSLAPHAQRTPTPTPGSKRALNAQLRDLINLSISSSTQATYGAGERKFYQFCQGHGVQPLPADKQTVVMFAVALSRSMAPLYCIESPDWVPLFRIMGRGL